MSQKTVTDRIRAELKSANEWRKDSPILASIVFLSAILIGGLYLYSKAIVIPNLNDKVVKLDGDLAEAYRENQKLETQIAPFRVLALQTFPGSESEALTKLLQRLGETEEKVNSIIDYSDWAILSAQGDRFLTERFKERGGDLYNWWIGHIRWESGYLKWDCTEEGISFFKGMTDKYPKFPFPYYFLADCLKRKEEPEWRNYAFKALEILKKTTTIPNHQKDHDVFLSNVKELLSSEEAVSQE